MCIVIVHSLMYDRFCLELIADPVEAPRSGSVFFLCLMLLVCLYVTCLLNVYCRLLRFIMKYH